SSATWASPVALAQGITFQLSQSLGASGGKAVYAWTSDLDGDLNSTGDRKVFYSVWTGQFWAAPLRVMNDAISDQNARVAVGSTGDVFMVWQKGTTLVMDVNFRGTPTVVRSNSSLDAIDFTLTRGPAGNLAVIWQQQTTSGSDPYLSVYDPASGQWSQDMVMF